jgi:hypothetical protein
VVAMTIFSSVEEYKRRDFYFVKAPTRSFDRVCERSKYTEFELFLDVITGDIQKRAPSQLHLVDLERFE